MGGKVQPGRPDVALGHPLRGALLDLLSRRATLTSTEAARELGESSGACSFHLRQLERYGHVAESGDEFGELARELENEGYRRWLAGRETAPQGWRDEAFSAVLYLTPGELAEVAGAIRSVLAPFAGREDPGQDTGAVLPVGVVARMFPLLPASSDG